MGCWVVSLVGARCHEELGGMIGAALGGAGADAKSYISRLGRRGRVYVTSTTASIRPSTSGLLCDDVDHHWL